MLVRRSASALLQARRAPPVAKWCSSTAAKASTPAPAPAPAPASSKSESTEQKTSIHSSDIAFKPNDDGWGYTKSYASGWDRIFAKNTEDAPPEQPAAAAAEAPPASTAMWPADDAARRAQVAALDAARDVGALSEALYAQARRELDGRS